MSWAKMQIRNASYQEWCHKWYQTKVGRQTKIWFPSLNIKCSNILTGLPRLELGLVIQMITGHNRLNRHENLCNPDVSPTCRFWRRRLRHLGIFLENVLCSTQRDGNPSNHPSWMIHLNGRLINFWTFCIEQKSQILTKGITWNWPKFDSSLNLDYKQGCQSLPFKK